jgi:hypothetical protein
MPTGTFSISCKTGDTARKTYEEYFENKSKDDIWNALMVEAAGDGYTDGDCQWENQPSASNETPSKGNKS